jgi:Immunoglobulin-like domain of bacterial spore germination/Sporulation and spore germination
MSDDDQMEARLRRALNSEATMVQPAGDGLQKIRSGIAGGGHRSWWRSPVAALAAAAVLGLAVGGLVFGLGGKNDDSTVATQSNTPTPTAKDTSSASPSPSSSSSPSGPTTATAKEFVYYVQANPEGPRLYREEHSVTGQVTNSGDGSTVGAELAVGAMLEQDPKDPDYSSPWPAGVRVLNMRQAADTVTVDLSKFLNQSGKLETAGVQQLVYTVTANDPSAKKVQLLVHGKAPQGHHDWSGPIRRAPMLDVQGQVWILAPTQNSTVTSPVAIDGYGTAFEATINWEVRKAGVVVAQGNTQGGSNGEFAEFHDTVKLPAGDYELSAFAVSAKDGTPVHIDTKNFTVR